MGFVGECPESVNQWERRPEVEYPRCRNMGHVAHNQICDHFIQPRLTVTRESCARVTFVFEYLLRSYTIIFQLHCLGVSGWCTELSSLFLYANACDDAPPPQLTRYKARKAFPSNQMGRHSKE